ncbi:adenylyl cyclase-associated protein 1-like isoform X4 [Penaeus japonicus]|uniref:adenylyl cyclase-associated protein 1-like isoform X4 n=1 Tax=Penaeus japonicus TaxID=27405 RepID=UPI001C70CD9A|nr:adenylyl cyclase-associated protein 1-like isoform X4 [Penaeus japonicus]
MGTACSCARDASEECPRADKTNGHVPDQDADGGIGQHNGPLRTAEHGTQTGRKNGAIPKISIGASSLDGHSSYEADEEAGRRPMVSPALTTSATPPLTSPALATPPFNSPALTTPSMTPSAFVTSPLTSPPASSLRADSGVDQGRCDEELEIMATELASLVTRLETAVAKLEKVGLSSPAPAGGPPAAPAGGGGGGAPDTAQQDERRPGLIWGEECTVPFVLAYDDLLSGPFKAFLDTSNQIGGDVASIAKMVQETFINQRAFLVMASKSQRPLDSELPQVLEPTGKKIQEVIAFRESKRQSPFFNHLSAVSESIPGLSWVAVSPAPSPYVKEMGDSAVFYTNRVLKEYKDKDKVHVEWVQHWNNVFKELMQYVKTHHTTGLSWNTRGGNAMSNLKAAPANCGVPPPPPPGIPPPPPMVPLAPKAAAAMEDDGRAALFASINKGTDITSGLKKVRDDQKTHKNPSLREGPKPFVKQTETAPVRAPTRESPERPPKFALEGKKWFVEYQKDKPSIVVDNAKMDQSVYIFKCQNTVVQVKGKVNSVILDSCKKSAVVFDNLVSSAEVVNCQSCKVQVMGIMPTITIEKTDGCHVYLSKESLNTEIISAKSSEMNILIPKDDGEFVECPVPEQFKTLIKGHSLVTTCTEKAG